MKRIWKYEIPTADEPVISMPQGAKLLSVGEQGRKLFVWAAVDPNADLRNRRLRVAGTGHPLGHPLEDMPFVGTVQVANGLVWHVFDTGEFPLAAN